MKPYRAIAARCDDAAELAELLPACRLTVAHLPSTLVRSWCLLPLNS